ncbi:MAG: FAD-dependent monooxygenase [Gammaproteobacteria bacterium]|nr:MAG: FAD-dependent monooxygenase [Gammaproteobacteria bacterium]
MEKRITIVGAGLVGALLGTLLAQRGFAVELFERRPDPRKSGFLGGRSINLALAERGWHGLRLAGLAETLRPLAVMMRGRMVHDIEGHTNLQRYGRDDSEVIWSINRGALNIALLDAAEAAGAHIHFDRRLETVEWGVTADAPSTLHFRDDARDDARSNATFSHSALCVIGADGAGSALRAAMSKHHDLGERFEPLDHAYKELEIPAAPSTPSLSTVSPSGERAGVRGALEPQADQERPLALHPLPRSPAIEGEGNAHFAMEPNALHIWPRGNYMCIALPNAEGSFTVTLFLPNEGDPSFARVRTGADAHALFARDFADALALIPDLATAFERNPTGLLGTLYLDRWHLDGRALLIGDAAHAIVPFHGQGMNCGFEDAVELAELLGSSSSTALDLSDAPKRQQVFAEFEHRRKPNADAIAAMALENYIEMRDRVDDADFLLMRALERVLAARHPGRFVPRYWMVTFSRLPYATAFERGNVQAQILRELITGKTGVDDIDLARADALIDARLPLLSA